MNKIKLELRNKEKKISFDEDTHTYNLNGEKCVSVTQLIKKHTPVFDEDGSITKRCAEKAGITIEEQKRMWEENMNIAAQKGTDTHTYCEHLTWGIPYPASEESGLETLKTPLNDFYDSNNPLSTEQIVYNEELRIAGTIDLITKENNGLILYDYKTNKKKITPDNYFQEKLLEPVQHLENNNYHKYALQLSIYRYMLEQWGFVVNSCHLIHLRKKELEFIKLPYLIDEVKLILTPKTKKRRG